MNREARKENLLTLQRLLNMDQENSEKIVGSSILLSIDGLHPRLEEFLLSILRRTFETVHTSSDGFRRYSCQVMTNPARTSAASTAVYLGTTVENCTIVTPNSPGKALQENQHPFFYFMTACYSGAMILKTLYKDLPVTASEKIIFDPHKIVTNPAILNKTVDVGLSYMAGAGAVGNAFLYALTTFHPEGEIRVTDPDFISDRNLNRCLFFEESDITQKKAEVIVKKAQIFFDRLKLTPFPDELANIKHNDGKSWLNKVIVGVDSRRARRKLQGEIPGEVFDASTTGISEVVVHHHKRPLQGACMGCIYVKEKVEEAHEKHVAESLGVTLVHVKELFITEEAAKLIGKKHKDVDTDGIVSLPYDTLFKQLCGEGKLFTNQNAQILAPLAFVSALAGAILALMFIERHLQPGDFNYWRLSPWSSMNLRLKQNVPTNPECEFCNNQIYNKIAVDLWH